MGESGPTSLALVCGGSRGIGLASARALAEQGCQVAILGRRQDRIDQAIAVLAEHGHPGVEGWAADATDPIQLARAFASIESRFDYLNVLVNAVGSSVVGTFDALDEDDWVRAFSEGSLSAVRTIKLALPMLRRAPWARIVNVTAMSTQHQTPTLVAYTASKAALTSITKNLSRYLAAEGILVNAVAPGSVMTGGVAAAVSAAGGDPSDPEGSYAVMADLFGAHIDLGRVADPEEVAQVVAFCASKANTFMTGAHINVDGGSDFT